MKGNQMIYIAVGAAAAYFGYRYAVQNLMIPDYLGIVPGFPRTDAELQAVVANLVANGAIDTTQVTPGGGSGTNTLPAGSGSGYGTGSGGTGNGASNGAGSSGNGSGQSAGSAGQSTTAKDQLWNAAKSEAASNGNRLNFWQFNYHLPSNLAKPDPFALGDAAWAGTPLGRQPVTPAEVINTPLTLDQYWSMVAGPLGLSGMRGMGSVNHWGAQASVWSGHGSRRIN